MPGVKCPPGCNCGKHTVSEEKRQKLSDSLKGRTLSDELRAKRSETTKRQWDDPNSAFNSAEYREKLSNLIRTPEYRQRQSETHLGKYKGVATSGHIDNGYRILCTQQGHPLSSGGVIAEHRLVLWEKLGCESLDCEHACHWCNKPLTWGSVRGIQADHLDSDKLNNRPENLVESCDGCNKSRAIAGNPTSWKGKALV